MIENKGKILIFVLSALSFIAAQQDLCDTAEARASSFAADPSDCTRYIHCQRNATDHLVRIGYGQCDQATEFKYFKNNKCTTDNSGCAPLALCTGSPDFRVASPSDSCTYFRYCKLEAMPPTNCTIVEGDFWAFDRNTGQCIDNTDGFIGNCPSADNPVTTPKPDPCENAAPNYIYVQDGPECGDWAFCVNFATYDRGSCPCGQKFGSISNPCVSDATCNPCETETTTPAAVDECAGKADGFSGTATCDGWLECASEVTTDSGTCDCGKEFDSTAPTGPPCKDTLDPTLHCDSTCAAPTNLCGGADFDCPATSFFNY